MAHDWNPRTCFLAQQVYLFEPAYYPASASLGLRGRERCSELHAGWGPHSLAVALLGPCPPGVCVGGGSGATGNGAGSWAGDASCRAGGGSGGAQQAPAGGTGGCPADSPSQLDQPSTGSHIMLEGEGCSHGGMELAAEEERREVWGGLLRPCPIPRGLAQTRPGQIWRAWAGEDSWASAYEALQAELSRQLEEL